MKAAEFKRIREAAGLTQQRIADELGVDRVTVARWETGIRRIPKMAERLLKVYQEYGRFQAAAPLKKRGKGKRG